MFQRCYSLQFYFLLGKQAGCLLGNYFYWEIFDLISILDDPIEMGIMSFLHKPGDTKPR